MTYILYLSVLVCDEIKYVPASTHLSWEACSEAGIKTNTLYKCKVVK